MLTILTVSEGSVNDINAFTDLLRGFDDGRYLVSVKKIGDAKTVKEWQEMYFAMCDIIRDSTGNDRYAIHNAFKAHEGITSTKELTEDDWFKFIENFKWWAFSEFDVVL